MTTYVGLDLLDGDGLRPDIAITVNDRSITAIAARDGRDGIDLSEDGERALVSPGLIDLQVNGGAGLMIGAGITGPQILDIADAHWETGSQSIVPTLISDTPEVTAHVIQQVYHALEFGNGMIAGLHLEGPHIAVPGAHDPAHLRPMNDADMALYQRAVDLMGSVIITVAPEVVPPEQIAALTRMGIKVALGHTACDYDTARAAFEAGAAMATHLYNAMPPLHHRAPGLVGATLDRGAAYGLIADGHHVHPAAARMALRSSANAVLVSDAMAPAGTDMTAFTLNGRRVNRAEGRLRLDDGTLAGADLSLTTAVGKVAGWLDAPIETVIPMAIDAPWQVLTGHKRKLVPGSFARLLIWRYGWIDARIDGTQILPVRA